MTYILVYYYMNMNDLYLKQLAKVIAKLDNEEKVINFLQAILTPSELEDIVNRLRIVKKLKNGHAQRQIADDLGVGIATVTRGSKELQKGNFRNV